MWTDLRELYLEIPSQTCITKDNAPIDIDFLIYWRVMDPALSVIQVANYAGASQKIATTTLRAVIGDIPLDDVLAKREDINRVLRTKLDEVTERWGVKVTSVEIREIVPPQNVEIGFRILNPYRGCVGKASERRAPRSRESSLLARFLMTLPRSRRHIPGKPKHLRLPFSLLLMPH